MCPLSVCSHPEPTSINASFVPVLRSPQLFKHRQDLSCARRLSPRWGFSKGWEKEAGRDVKRLYKKEHQWNRKLFGFEDRCIHLPLRKYMVQPMPYRKKKNLGIQAEWMWLMLWGYRQTMHRGLILFFPFFLWNSDMLYQYIVKMYCM